MARVKIAVIVVLFFQVFPVMVSAQTVSLTEDTLMAFHFNLSKVYQFYRSFLGELGKPENRQQIDEINAQFSAHMPGQTFDLEGQINSFLTLEKEGLFLPNGGVWFAIDDRYRPQMKIKAKIKPQQLYKRVFTLMGEPKHLVAAINEENLVEIVFSAVQFKVFMRMAADEISLYCDKKSDIVGADRYWAEFIERSKSSGSLFNLLINFAVVNKLVKEKTILDRHAQCLGNLVVLKNSVEYFQLETGAEMKELNQELLVIKHHLATILHCPEGGTYRLQENGVPICSVHGSVEMPIPPRINEQADPDPRIKSFSAFRLDIDDDRVLTAMQINDPELLRQWEAICRQQILTIRHMAENQLGHLPQEQKNKMIEIANSIKCSVEKDWLFLYASGINDKLIAAGIMGLAEAARNIILPKFLKARDFEAKHEKNKLPIFEDIEEAEESQGE